MDAAALSLDVLLEELLLRVREVTDARERLSGLLDAVVAVGADLELDAMLDRVVTSACKLVDARFGSLTVNGPDGRVARVHTCGGETGGAGRLEVPVSVRERDFGTLRLVNDTDFTEDDERVVGTLATAAGIAIENARLYDISRRRLCWLEAAAEITDLLLGAVDRRAALRLVAQRARETSRACLALVVVRDPDDMSQVVVEVADTETGELPIVGDRVPLDEDALGLVITRRRPAQVTDLATVCAWPTPFESGPALLVPLSTSETAYGALIVITDATYSSAEIGLLEAFAGQAALALDRARAQQDRAQLAVLEDRDRIARDLHDVVIQRLFATGLHLQNVVHLTRDIAVVDRVNSAVDSLDATIRDIRASIYALHGGGFGDLRLGVHTAVEAACDGLGFRPSVTLAGPVDAAVPASIRPELLAALRELLSNVTRHARASEVDIAVVADGESVELVVCDDGSGVGHARPRGGLLNLAERARKLGGMFRVEAAEPRGTRVTWQVPLL